MNTPSKQSSPRQEPSASPRRRWVRWAVVIGVVLAAVGAAAWLAIEALLDVDRYRPQAAEAIREFTGLPVSLGEFDLRLFPSPSLQARAVRVGEGDFQATARRIIAYPELAALWERRIQVTEVEIDALKVNLPEEPADMMERFNRLTPRGRGEERAPRKDGSRFEVEIGSVRAEGAEIVLGTGAEVAALCDIEVDQLLSASIQTAVTSRLPVFGEDASLAADFVIRPHAGEETPAEVEGTVRIAAIDTDTFLKNPVLVPMLLDGKAGFRAAGGVVTVRLDDGAADPKQLPDADTSAFRGTFMAEARWEDGGGMLDAFEWDSPGLRFTADGTYTPGGDWEIELPSVAVPNQGLATLLAMHSPGQLRAELEPTAEFTASDVVCGQVQDGLFKVREGSGRLHGFDLILTDGAHAFDDIRIEVQAEQGVFHITNATSDQVALRGTVEPDLVARTFKVDLEGEMALSAERFKSFYPVEGLDELGGQVNVERLSGTFEAGGGVPADLLISGTWQDGAVRFASDSWEDSATGIEARFTAEQGEVRSSLSAVTERLGPIRAEGVYRNSERRWQGRIYWNPAGLDVPLPEEGGARDIVPVALGMYGDSVFDVALTLPGPVSKDLRVQAVRQGEPQLEGTVVFPEGAGGRSLGVIQAQGTVPLQALEPLHPAGWTLEGAAPVAFRRHPDEERLEFTADLTPCLLKQGAYLEKEAGDPAEVRVTGPAGDEKWAAERLEISYGGETIAGRFGEEGLVFDNLDVALAPLSGLLTAGAQASGNVAGRIAVSPLDIQLNLDQVSLALDEEARVDAVSGPLTYRDGIFQCRQLQIEGANSKCTLTARMEDGTWRGELTGERLDATAVQALLEELRAHSQDLESPGGKETPDSGEGAGVEGTFNVSLDALRYHDTVFTDPRVTVAFNEEQLRATNVSMRPDQGSLTGECTVDFANGDEPTQVDFTVDLSSVSAQVIDQLLFDEPRGLQGSVTGAVRMRLPLGGENAYSGYTGAYQIAADKGTLGQLGVATKILAVIRTTELLRLRLPALRDEGLSFDTMVFEALMEKGVLRIDKCHLKRPSYQLDMTGTVDLPQWKTNLVVLFNPLQTVTGVAKHVPVLRDAAGVIEKVGGLKIVLTGPPDDMKPASVTPLGAGAVGSEAGGAVKEGAGGTADVVEGVTDVVTDILKDAIGQ